MKKKAFRKILKSPVVVSLLAVLVSAYIRLMRVTNRWKILNKEVAERAKKEWKGSVVVVFWHGRLMMNPVFVPRGIKMNILASRSRDGELIARVQENFGFKTIRGSSAMAGKTGKGGTDAVRGLLKVREKGETVALVPDGPRGPARKVSPNALKILKKLEMPIIPVTFSCTKYREANSWDKFRVVLPFGKGVFVYGTPILPGNVDQLEAELNRITDEADFVAKTI